MQLRLWHVLFDLQLPEDRADSTDLLADLVDDTLLVLLASLEELVECCAIFGSQGLEKVNLEAPAGVGQQLKGLVQERLVLVPALWDALLRRCWVVLPPIHDVRLLPRGEVFCFEDNVIAEPLWTLRRAQHLQLHLIYLSHVPELVSCAYLLVGDDPLRIVGHREVGHEGADLAALGAHGIPELLNQPVPDELAGHVLSFDLRSQDIATLLGRRSDGIALLGVDAELITLELLQVGASSIGIDEGAQLLPKCLHLEHERLLLCHGDGVQLGVVRILTLGRHALVIIGNGLPDRVQVCVLVVDSVDELL
mmetsp:Transcript_15588/g.33087  ORF Transcript_15588/g.33087 Transcript_15588/m.33087 type:complete len:308 (+) Transcript_15588:2345-3268(+)